MAIRSTLVSAALLALAGCSGSPNYAAMGMSEARCRAAGAEPVLGQTLDPQVMRQALATSGGMRSRVIKPGAQVTMDADPMRLNIEVDENGRIRRMVCG